MTKAKTTDTSQMTAAEKRAQRKAEKEAAAKLAAQSEKNGGVTDTERLNQAAMTRPDQVADAHGKIEKPSNSGGKVIVACKVGVAYLDIQLCRPETVSENTQTGPRDVTIYRRTGTVVRLRGTAYPRGTVPDGFPEKPVMVGGAALNYDVDEDFWNEWVRQNARNPLYMNGFIFAHRDVDFVKGRAKDESAKLSGLEPINPKSDKRMPKSTRSDVSNVETEESRAARMSRIAG